MRINLFEPDVAWCAEAVANQVRSDFVGPGAAVLEFERLLADRAGAEYAICTTSGTVALMLCMMAMELPEKCKVGFPAYGMPAGANAARLLGHEVRLYDVNENGCLIDFPSAETDLVIAITHNGSPCSERCDIRDDCQSLGIPSGSARPPFRCLSFSPQKIITTGQGGAVLTDDKHLAERIRRLTDHGGDWREDRIYKRVGGNFRMSDLQASLGLPQLRRLPELIDRRRQIRGWYRDRFPWISSSDGWMIVFPSRDAVGLVKYLEEQGISAGQLYPPVSWSEPFKTDEMFRGAENYHRQMVYLPSHFKLNKTTVSLICDCIERFENGEIQSGEIARRVRHGALGGV